MMVYKSTSHLVGCGVDNDNFGLMVKATHALRLINGENQIQQVLEELN
jgi:hypothetical protein